MARSLTKLNFHKVSHAISGFLTVMVMPLTYSIAYGLIAGIGAYLVMESTFWLLSFVGLEVPVDEEQADKHIIGKSFRNLTGKMTMGSDNVDNDYMAKEPADTVRMEETQKGADGDGDEEAAVGEEVAPLPDDEQ